MLTPSLACGKDQSPGISTHPAHGPLTRLCFPGGAKEQMPESSSREHTFPLDRAVKGAAAKVLSLNLSHPEAGRQAPQGDTEYPGPPHPCAAPGARRSSPVCRSHPRGTGSTHPCKYHELPERKKSNNPIWGSPKGLFLPQHAADRPALRRTDAAQHSKGAASDLGSFSPSSSYYGVRSVLCSLSA